MRVILLRDADDLAVSTPMLMDTDPAVTLGINGGWNFVVIRWKDQDGEATLVVDDEDGINIDLAADTQDLKCWLISTPKAIDVEIKFDSCSEAIECFHGSLPDPIQKIINAGEPSQIAAVRNVLVAVFSGKPFNLDLPKTLEPRAQFDVLHACAAVARRIGFFEAEIQLIEAAIKIRRSRNLLRLLPYAYSNAHAYGRARVAAREAVEADPAIANQGFGNHLNELNALSDLLTEIETFADPNLDPIKSEQSIAYCLHNCLPFAQQGYAIRSHSIARELLSKGRKLTAFARPGFPDLQLNRNDPLSESRSYSLDGVEYNFEPDLDRRGQQYAYLKQAADHFERCFSERAIGIVQAASNFWTALPAAIAAKRLNLPFVYEVRSFWDITREAREPGFQTTRQAWRDVQLETITLALADHVVTLTEPMARHIQQYGVAGHRITVAPNCVDASLHMPSPRDSTKASEYGVEPEDIVIGYLGSMLRYEGLADLVQASRILRKQFPNVKFLIVGADPDKRLQTGSVEHSLDRQIRELGVGDTAILSDRVPVSEVPAVLSLFDICAYPRLGFEVCELVSPLKPLEAMAAEKAVIVSNVGGMREMVKHRETGLIHQSGDIDALAAGLADLVADARLRRSLGSAAGKFVRTERTWSRSADSIIAAQESATKAHRLAWPSERRQALLSSLEGLRS